jgi:small subunit ribosomal protein S20
MAHHKSALKRIRQNSVKRLKNRFYKKTARTAVKNLRNLTETAEAEKFLPKVISMIDRLAKSLSCILKRLPEIISASYFSGLLGLFCDPRSYFFCSHIN